MSRRPSHRPHGTVTGRRGDLGNGALSLRSAWPRVRARADRRPVNGGYGTTGYLRDRRSERERLSLAVTRRAGAEVFEKPSGDEENLLPRPSGARAAGRPRGVVRLPPDRANSVSASLPRALDVPTPRRVLFVSVRSRAVGSHRARHPALSEERAERGDDYDTPQLERSALGLEYTLSLAQGKVARQGATRPYVNTVNSEYRQFHASLFSLSLSLSLQSPTAARARVT